MRTPVTCQRRHLPRLLWQRGQRFAFDADTRAPSSRTQKGMYGAEIDISPAALSPNSPTSILRALATLGCISLPERESSRTRYLSPRALMNCGFTSPKPLIALPV